MVAAFQRGRRFLSHDVWYIGRPGEEVPSGFIIKQVRVAILLVSNVIEGSLMLRASALTFATILSIVPFLAIMFAVIQTFNLAEGITEELRSRMESTIAKTSELVQGEGNGETVPPETVSTETDPAEPGLSPVDETPTSDDGAIQSAATASQDKNKELEDDLIDLIFRNISQVGADPDRVDPIRWLADLADQAARDPRALSMAGVLLFVSTVFGLLRNIEMSFNQIWGVRTTRSWYRMVSDYVMITLLFPFIAAAVLGVTAVLQSEEVLRQLGPFAIAVRGLEHLVIWLVFASLYFVVPNTRVKFFYALLGGVVAGTSWILLSWAYVEFQIGITKYNLVFSGFAQFPMLLMWVYSSWVILLFGAELSFAYQNEKTFAMERMADGASFAYREAVGIRAMVELGRCFGEGQQGPTPGAAARSLNVPTRLMNDTLDHLEKAGLVTACATNPVTYQPAKPLDRMTVGDILTVIREVGRDPSLLRDDEEFKPVFDALNSPGGDLGRSTVAELIERLKTAPDAVESGQPSSAEGETHDQK